MMGVLDEPLRTDLDDNTQTDAGVHAGFHNDANDAINNLDVKADEPFRIEDAVYDAGTDTITVTVGRGRAQFSPGVIVEFDTSQTIDITPVALDTTYYVFLGEAGLNYSTAVDGGDGHLLGVVITDVADKATLTRDDRRGQLPVAPPLVTPAVELIGVFDLTADAGMVVIQNIPQTYRDLILAADLDTVNTGTIGVRLNNDSGASRHGGTYHRSSGASISGGSESGTFGRISGPNDFTSRWRWTMELLSYSEARETSCHWIGGVGGSHYTAWGYFTYTQAVAVTRIDLVSATYLAGSRIALYGRS